jgi:hypothetical protein
MLKFTLDDLPNTHLIFNGTQTKIVVTLNIEEKLIPFLNMSHVFKGEQMWVYSLSFITFGINEEIIRKAHQHLLNQAMIHIREGKIKMLQFENLKLKNKCI